MINFEKNIKNLLLDYSYKNNDFNKYLEKIGYSIAEDMKHHILNKKVSIISSSLYADTFVKPFITFYNDFCLKKIAVSLVWMSYDKDTDVAEIGTKSFKSDNYKESDCFIVFCPLLFSKKSLDSLLFIDFDITSKKELIIISPVLSDELKTALMLKYKNLFKNGFSFISYENKISTKENKINEEFIKNMECVIQNSVKNKIPDLVFDFIK